jgi:hypothetical protein
MNQRSTAPFLHRAQVFALALGTLLLNACQDHRVPPVPAFTQTFYGLTDDNHLLTYKPNGPTSNAPINPTETVTITGLQGGETIRAIDFRPATGQMYGVGSTSRLYVIDPATGKARAIGAVPFSPALAGTTVALDFNPTVDRIRLVTSEGQNLRLNPETGAVQATDGMINGASGGTAAIGAAAYTNNFAGTTTTVLYDIDPATDRLYIQNPPNDGRLQEVGSLGLNITAVGGFDISPDNSMALASVQFEGRWELSRVDLNTGLLQKLGDLAVNLIGLAIPTNPVAYAVDESNNLLIFNPTNGGTPLSKAITGLQPGEVIHGIDFRPANGQLYAIGSTSRLYTINTSSGAAMMVGSAPLSPALSGTDFGFDFNPTVDRIRLVSNTGQNLRLHPDLGTVVMTDGTLRPGTPSVTGSAYTNNVAGATTTVLFNLDSQSDKLVRQDPPNDGVLVEIGSLNVNIDAANGFDIGGQSGTAFALLRVGGSTGVYSINLTTGAATRMGDFPTAVRGMAVGLGF